MPTPQSLMKAWNEHAHRFALFIPFLVGATTIKANPMDLQIEDLEQMLRELDSDPSPRAKYLIGECDGKQEIRVSRSESKASDPVFPDSETRGLWIASYLNSQAQTERLTISEWLWKRYGELIQAGRFSKNNGVWGKFSPQDKKVISEAEKYGSSRISVFLESGLADRERRGYGCGSDGSFGSRVRWL
jgi:hypothetical protein